MVGTSLVLPRRFIFVVATANKNKSIFDILKNQGCKSCTVCNHYVLIV